MTPTNEAPPSRAMDAAVARAMGYTIWMANTAPDGWALWDGSPTDTLYIRYREGMRNWLPRYTDPDSAAYHRAALLDAVLWLGERRVAVTRGQQNWWALREERVVGSAVGDSLTAYALCVCRAVLTVAGVREVTE